MTFHYISFTPANLTECNSITCIGCAYYIHLTDLQKNEFHPNSCPIRCKYIEDEQVKK